MDGEVYYSTFFDNRLPQTREQAKVPIAIHMLSMKVPPLEIINLRAWQCGVGAVKGDFKKPMKVDSAQ
jgi:hypothetical protein